MAQKQEVGKLTKDKSVHILLSSLPPFTLGLSTDAREHMGNSEGQVSTRALRSKSEEGRVHSPMYPTFGLGRT